MASDAYSLSPIHVTWPRSSVTAWSPHHEGGQRYVGFTKAPVQALWDLYARAARQFPELEFVVHADRRATYAQVFHEADRVAAMLEARGVKPGDRVACLGKNSIEWVSVYVAATWAGFIAVPMNSWWTGKEIAYAVRDSGCVALFMDAERAKRVAALPKGEFPDTCRLVVSLERDAFAETLAKHGAPVTRRLVDRPPPASVDEGAILMYTSGTTAHPKGVLLTHRGVAHCMTVYELMTVRGASKRTGGAGVQAEPQKVILLSVPLFHATGLHAVLMASAITGRKIVMMPDKWNPEVALELIERERVTAFTGVPTMVQSMLASPDLAKRDVSSLKALGSGGAPPPAGLAKAVSEKFKGASPGQGYGLTEVNALACTFTGQDYVKFPTACGRVVPGVEVQIWPEDKDDAPLPPDTPGRVMIRGPTVMREYWGQPQATAKAISKSGWFDSGDIGIIRGDGGAGPALVEITGRAKDMIIRGGENIACRAVEEAVFAAFPDVAECAAFGVPHAMLGEHVGLAIVMKRGTAAPTLDGIRAKLKSTLADFELPTGLVVFPDMLPRGATGKIVKKDIRALVTGTGGKLPQGVVWVTGSKF